MSGTRVVADRRRALGVRAVVVVVIGASALTAGKAWGRSRDFAAAAEREEPIQPPTPRASRLFLSLGLGVDALVADWRQPDLGPGDPHTSANTNLVRQLGPAMRLGAGARLNHCTAVFIEGSGTVPVVPLGNGVALAGVGIGADWFVSADSPWHLRAQARRVWGYRSRYSLVQEMNPPPDPSGRIWLVEAAVGRARRRGLVDSGWLVSVFFGSLSTASGQGWTTGLGLGYSWSRA